jgi:hypothetical protein
LVYKSIKYKKPFSTSTLYIFVAVGLTSMIALFGVNSVHAQIGLIDENGKSEYDRQCGTNIANLREAEIFLAIGEDAFGKNIDDYPPASKELYQCVKNVYDQETEMILGLSKELAND